VNGSQWSRIWSRGGGLFRLKLPETVGGFEADLVTEMLVLEALAYQDYTSGWRALHGLAPKAMADGVLVNLGSPNAEANTREVQAAARSCVF
jgi:hypothetical protein